MSVKEHIAHLIRWMSQGVYEKEQVIAVALLTAVAGENIFLLGPPGTAKSLVAARLKMVFKDGRSFDYLMSRFSTPDEIFGPISISRLKNEDRYERLTAGYLPEADVVFLDEIWKAGPSIQNTLLTVINEHIFHNGGRVVTTPMKVLIAASNELPAKDEGLEALWDRFLMRMVSNCISADSAFFKMIKTDSSVMEPLAESLYITDEIYERWQKESTKVGLGEIVAAAIRALRKILAAKEKEDGNALRYYVSDRRWRKAFRLMQTSAYLNGREEIDLSDYLLLTHSFWNDVDCIPVIIEAFADSVADAMNRRLDKIEKNLRQLMSNDNGPGEKIQSPAQGLDDFVEYDYFYYKLENYPDGEAYFAKWDYPSLSTTPKDGIRYYDLMRRKHIIHVNNPAKPFDTKAMNVSEVTKIKLEKWKDGVIVDGTPYRFCRTFSSEAATTKQPFYFRVGEVVKEFNECVSAWENSIDVNYKACDNLFLSPADLSIIDKMRKSVADKIKILEVKINNLKVMTQSCKV